MNIDVQRWMNDKMKECGMNQADVARASGLSTAVIAQIATGKTKNPTISNVIRIAKALNTSIDSIEYYIVEL